MVGWRGRDPVLMRPVSIRHQTDIALLPPPPHDSGTLLLAHLLPVWEADSSVAPDAPLRTPSQPPRPLCERPAVTVAGLETRIFPAAEAEATGCHFGGSGAGDLFPELTLSTAFLPCAL